MVMMISWTGISVPIVPVDNDDIPVRVASKRSPARTRSVVIRELLAVPARLHHYSKPQRKRLVDGFQTVFLDGGDFYVNL